MSTPIKWRRGTDAQHDTFTGLDAEVTVNTDTRALHVHDGVTPGGSPLAPLLLLRGLFSKADPYSVAFTKTGGATASIKAGTLIEVGGKILKFDAATAITMPGSMTTGADYAIYACADGSLRADTSFSAPTGYDGAYRKIGGFHYAPGGNATGRNTGGSTVSQINEFSFWDFKFKPNCADPRGMVLVEGKFWTDIYILGVNHITDGTSKYSVAMATGSAPPKVPTMYGGNGTTAYADGNWFSFHETLSAYGKRFPTYAEFAALAFGTKEKISAGPASGGSAPNTGQSNASCTSTWENFTSIWGVVQASGNLWVWGEEFGGPYGAASYADTPDARGQWYSPPNAALFGGSWSNATTSGSRASYWSHAPSNSAAGFGARGVCDHLMLV